MKNGSGLLVITAVAMHASLGWAVTYHASPTGGGDGRSKSSPFQIADFWSVAKPGDTLLLLDGKYSGAACMISPPRGEFREGKLVQKGLCGEPGKPITVKAPHDGKVEIDGEGRHIPVDLDGNDYFVLEGFNAHHSSRWVVGLVRSDHNIVRRVCAWEAADHNNGSCFAAHSSEHNLFEDCAGWGTSRYVLVNSQGGNYTTFRRCWGRWEGCHVAGPKTTFCLSYNAHHSVLENCIGTWDPLKMKETYVLLDGTGQKPYVDAKSRRYKQPLTFTNYEIEQPRSVFFGGGKSGARTEEIHDRILGCIAYVLNPRRFSAPWLYLWWPQDAVELRDCVAYIGAPNSLTAFDLAGRSEEGIVAENLTAISGQSSHFVNCKTRNVLEFRTASGLTAQGGALLQARNGATVLYRYENGKLTGQPLWPWPMNQRILDAMKRAGYDDPVDVTKTIFELAGAKAPDFAAVQKRGRKKGK